MITLADKSDHGSFLPLNQMGLVATFLDAFDDVVDLFLGRVRCHVDDHRAPSAE